MERTRHEQVIFLHPALLAGVDQQLEPGTYTVETIEEPIDGLSFVAYRRVATTIVLPSREQGDACRQAVTIDPRALEAAKQKDAELANNRPAPTPPAGAPRSATRSALHHLRNGTAMTQFLSHWMTEVHADRLVVGFNAALTVVFMFMGLQLAV